MGVLKHSGLFLGVLLAVSGSVRAQISPGPLSRGHESLEGMTNCTSCHERGAEIGRSKCLECHTEIAFLLEKKHGMHARTVRGACNDCHKEHLGREASITRFSPSTFDHEETGFALSGKHQGVECAKCHERQSFQVEKGALPKTRTRKTFLGLKAQCSSCHEDRHGGTVSNECQTCHSTSGWTPFRNFDHSKARFPLTGRHEKVICAECHESLKPAPRPANIVFTVSAFSDCTPCHRSPHKPEFSKNRLCRDCHSTEGWKSTKGFDHSVTRFPLVGRHLAVSCEKCHSGMKGRKAGGSTDFSTKPFADCSSCHFSPHAPALNRSKCNSCHTPVNWKSVHNRGFDHSQTDFPLRGKHATVNCEGCHQSDRSKSFAVQYRSAQRCSTCHRDYHEGALDKRYKDCSDCHREDGFISSTFSHADHARGRFPLTGAHGAVLCRECHKKNEQTMTFVFQTVQCSSCHSDYHRGTFQKVMGSDGCATCHTTTAWDQIRFDHQRTSFSLDGRHRSVDCDQCHKQSKGSIQYAGTPKACASCHKDPHIRQFARGGMTRCESCHTSRSWRMLIFNHETQSSFHLTGAHSRVPCGACHREEKSPRGSFVRFKPLPTTCEGCHQGKR